MAVILALDLLLYSAGLVTVRWKVLGWLHLFPGGISFLRFLSGTVV